MKMHHFLVVVLHLFQTTFRLKYLHTKKNCTNEISCKT